MKKWKIPKWYSESVNRKTDNTMTERKRTKGQTTIYKTLDRKLQIEQHEPHLKPGVNSGAPEGSAVHVPNATPVVLLLNDTNII